jgi:hypothetical protein
LKLRRPLLNGALRIVVQERRRARTRCVIVTDRSRRAAARPAPYVVVAQ